MSIPEGVTGTTQLKLIAWFQLNRRTTAIDHAAVTEYDCRCLLNIHFIPTAFAHSVVPPIRRVAQLKLFQMYDIGHNVTYPI